MSTNESRDQRPVISEATVREAIRRVKLEGKNDPAFIPPVDDAGAILAARMFGSSGIGNTAASSEFTAVDDEQAILANRIFSHAQSGNTPGTTGNTLTFGTHLTGTSYDGSAPVTIATDAVSTNTPSTLVARDGSGNFAAGTISAALSGNATTATTATNATNVTSGAGSVDASTGHFHSNVDVDGTLRSSTAAPLEVRFELLCDSGVDIQVGQVQTLTPLAIVGYITGFKDAGGTPIKLAVVS